MNLFDYIRIAFRNLLRRKLRSSLTIIAVVIGSVSVIVMVSLVIGAKNVFMQQLESLGALTMVTVMPSTEIESDGPNLMLGGGDNNAPGGVKLDEAMVAKVKQVSQVTSVTPSVSVWAFETISLKGSEKKYRPDFIALEPNGTIEIDPVAGRTLRPDDLAKIVLGGSLAKKFGYKDNPEGLIGKTVVLTAKGWYSGYGVEPEKPPRDADKDWWEAQEKKTHEIEAEIIGVLPPGMNDYQSYVSLAWAREIMTERRWEWDEEAQKKLEEQRRQEEELGKQQRNFDWDAFNRKYDQSNYNFQKLVTTDRLTESGYGSILAKVDDMANVETAAAAIEKLGVGTATAKDFLDQLSRLFTIIGAILGAIGGIALTVAAIGIINTMVMATYERTREIGVMRACGATRAIIRKLFTFEAALLGLWGGVIGLVISYGLALLGNYIGNQYTAEQNIPISNIITFPWWLVLGVLAFTTFIGTLAGLYPAAKAARLNPIEALRRE